MADPIWLPDVLRAEGLRCDIYPGAFDRGHGDFGNIWGVVCHHTGSFGESPHGIAEHPTLGLASQLYLSPDGVYTLCGVGIAWHAGSGSWPGIPANGANQVTIGIEAANDGGGTPGKPHRSSWSDQQYDAYVRGVAAILRHLNQPASHAIGHKEWAGAAQGKWDPGAIDMNIFRQDVTAHLAGPVGPVVNAIDEAYGAAPWLGKRLSDELSTPDGRGRFSSFENGHIYWTPTTGARPIPRLLFETYAKLGFETGPLGYPTRFFTVVPNTGDIQAFEGGVLYRKYGQPDGFFVHGKIGEEYAARRFEAGPLGWPTSNEITFNGGVYQNFENGSLIFSPSSVVAVKSPNVISL
jgi:hypothetical protein